MKVHLDIVGSSVIVFKVIAVIFFRMVIVHGARDGYHVARYGMLDIVDRGAKHDIVSK